jgi:nucleoside-diphosphate-sugar epimerase
MSEDRVRQFEGVVRGRGMTGSDPSGSTPGAVLVTGASGFIGSRLVKTLGPAHKCIALSRKPVEGAAVSVRGDFSQAEDLHVLDGHEISTVVHLASEIGGCGERAGLAVNVDGTRTLMRYLIDHGCRRFVMASSIAAVGCLDPAFRPRQLPVPDDHPCDATDAYGLSKWLLEELTYYFSRQRPDLDFTLFRIGLVMPEDTPPVDSEVLGSYTQPFTDLGAVSLHDVLAALRIAVAHPLAPGVRRMNLVAPVARTPIPTAEAVVELLGGRAAGIDLSYYSVPGNEFSGVFSTARLRDTFGFVPEINVRTMTPDQSTTPAVAGGST